MIHRLNPIILYILLVIFGFNDSNACTIVMLSDQYNAIAGSNEDSYIVLTKIWFEPGKNGEYSRVCLGYDFGENSLQGGMNEMGLFIDGNALGPKDWKPDPGKMEFDGKLLDTILAECATVQDVKRFFNKYNVRALNSARFPVMDKSGASMVVEWYNEEVTFLESEKNYQVATNFIGSDYINRKKPCWRYNNAVKVLEKNNEANIENVKNALFSARQDNEHAITVYSFICDLKKGEIYVYNWHDFENSIKYVLNEEIAKGYSENYLYNIFEPSPDYRKFIENGVYEMVNYGYRENNLDVALWFYDICRNRYKEIFNIDAKPDDLFKLANQLVEENNPDDALILLKKNTLEFPEHIQSFIKTAKVYEEKGEYYKAISYYAQALDLDHDNEELQNKLKEVFEKIRE